MTDGTRRPGTRPEPHETNARLIDDEKSGLVARGSLASPIKRRHREQWVLSRDAPKPD